MLMAPSKALQAATLTERAHPLVLRRFVLEGAQPNATVRLVGEGSIQNSPRHPLSG
jgi:hypothetical protein